MKTKSAVKTKWGSDEVSGVNKVKIGSLREIPIKPGSATPREGVVHLLENLC